MRGTLHLLDCSSVLPFMREVKVLLICDGKVDKCGIDTWIGIRALSRALQITDSNRFPKKGREADLRASSTCSSLVITWLRARLHLSLIIIFFILF